MKGLASGLTHDDFLNGTVALIGTDEQAANLSKSASDKLKCEVAPQRLRAWQTEPELSVWRLEAVESKKC